MADHWSLHLPGARENRLLERLLFMLREEEKLTRKLRELRYDLVQLEGEVSASVYALYSALEVDKAKAEWAAALVASVAKLTEVTDKPF